MLPKDKVFNIFDSPTKDSIRVGYISTERGLVEGVSIPEANQYAKLNPGTQFFLRNREKVQYLNINEVNKLEPKDIIPKGDCKGVQFKETEFRQTQVFFTGGGGVGAQGNPIIGQDGSLLGVDLIHRGYGYEYPPIVEVYDENGVGVGAEIGRAHV